MSYPVNYVQGHFSTAAPYGFDGTNDFSKAWLSDGFPRMLAVTFQHPTPYFDDSYAVNSVNNGPYGDAIMQELIPELERRFRVIREPYARILSGGSTGGWEAAALQIFHPDFFGGAWAYCPDSVTFTDVEGINIYEDENAFYKVYDWRKVPTANSRMVNGQLVMTSQQRNYFELVNGTRGRSGEQLDVWSSVFGPIGWTATSSRCSTRRPASSTSTSPRTGRSTTTCSTTSRRTGPPSDRRSSTSCFSTPATPTPTT